MNVTRMYNSPKYVVQLVNWMNAIRDCLEFQILDQLLRTKLNRIKQHSNPFKSLTALKDAYQSV